MNRPPVVAIVGRPNVGKSSLLNALSGKRISIVQDMPGVTRDRVSTPLQVGKKFVELMDTGGYGFVDPDQLTDHIKHQIELAMAQAKLVLFVVDCQDGLTPADQEIAGLLRRLGANVVLIANKADSEKADVILGEFARLGLGTPVGVSAKSERNLEDIADAIARNLDLSGAPESVPDPELYVAIVGKRNAGKSTLVNAIAEVFEGTGDRVIVSEVPGTTRDSVDVRFEKDGRAMVVIDTAGVRKKRHMVTNDIEFYSFHRAQRSVRRAGVVLMLIDANEPVSEPDKKLAMYIADEFKPVVLVVNKWDVARAEFQRRAQAEGRAYHDADAMAQYREYLDQELKHLTYAPIAFITAKETKNVQQVVDLSQHLFNQANTRVSTSKLNEAVRQIMEERQPSTPYGRRVKIFYVTQTDVQPPTIVLFANNPEFFTETYQRFMVNRMRELLPYKEVPIRLFARARERKTIEEAFEAGRNRPVKRRPTAAPARGKGRTGAGGASRPRQHPAAAKAGKPKGRPGGAKRK